jgi:hypothetical protein
MTSLMYTYLCTACTARAFMVQFAEICVRKRRFTVDGLKMAWRWQTKEMSIHRVTHAVCGLPFQRA